MTLNLKQLGVIAGLVIVIIVLLILVSGECFGAETCNPTGNPIGGGAGYTRIISETDAGVKYVVSTSDQLLTALKNAQSGDVVFVKGDAVIDLSGTSQLNIPAGVSLASNRGSGGSTGAVIKKRTGGSPWTWTQSMFNVGNNVRITGLVLEGEMKPQDDVSVTEEYYLVGLRATGGISGFEVDNCEIRGWSWAGVLLGNGISTTGNAFIHHNYVHHNQARGEGYGVELFGGTALIESNLFDYNRHSITGSGVAGESYEARYNHVLGHGNAIGASHFDVHQNPDGEFSGYEYKIHHNTFDASKVYATGFQGGVPESGIWIDHNIIVWDALWSDRPVFQYALKNNKTHVTQNMIGNPPVLVPIEEGVIMYLD